MLRGEVEEGEGAESGGSALGAQHVHACNRGGCKKVPGVGIDLECDVRIGALRHLQVENDFAAHRAEIEQPRRLRLLGYRFAHGDRVGNLVLSSSCRIGREYPQVDQRRLSVGKDLRVQYRARLPCARRHAEHAHITQVVRLRHRRLIGRGTLPEEKRHQRRSLHFAASESAPCVDADLRRFSQSFW